MNNNQSDTFDLNGLKPEQIKQLQTIIESFKEQNQKEETFSPSDKQKQGETESFDDIFFESDIIPIM